MTEVGEDGRPHLQGLLKVELAGQLSNLPSDLRELLSKA
jgi:hypothetical protein